MFKVGTDTCSRCHSKEMLTGVQLMMGDDSKAPVTPNVAGPGRHLDRDGTADVVGWHGHRHYRTRLKVTLHATEMVGRSPCLQKLIGEIFYDWRGRQARR